MVEGKSDVIKTIKSAVNKFVNFVESTYGPANNNIILKVGDEVYALDDGVSISRVFYLDDENENAVLKLIKEASIKTSHRVKDGTTTALLILKALLNTKQHFTNDLVELLKKAGEEAKQQLRVKSLIVHDKQELINVGKIAYNNEKIARNVAEMVDRLGEDGTIAVEASDKLTTDYHVLTGMKVDSGYASPHMVTDQGTLESNFEDALILVTDKPIKSHNDVRKLMNNLIGDDKTQLVIFAQDFEGDALATFNVNKFKGIFDTLAIAIPYHLQGSRRNEFFLDICAITGATLISDDTNTTLDDVTPNQLGHAEKVSSNNNETKIIGGNISDEQMKDRENHYKKSMETGDANENARLKRNLANLTGGIGVIKVGANTTQEVNTMIPKIENVVNSVLGAKKHGISKGSALALAEIETSSSVLNKALKYPSRVLAENSSGYVTSLFRWLFRREFKDDYAYNYVTKEYGNYLDVGVVDSTDTLCVSIDSAISVAGTLINNKGIFIDNRENRR